jgi:MSHA biogenesis protein MshI
MANAGWGLFSKRRRASVGQAALSLAADRVALVVQPAGGRPATAYERATGGDVAGTLQALVREAGAEGMACEWVLDPGGYSLLQVDKPAVPPEEWVQALRFKVRDLIGFPLEDAVMDAFEVPGLDSRGRPPTLYLAVARKDELRPQIAAIEAAGLQLERIGIADLAWAEAARQLSPSDDSQVALALDARGGSMLALRERTLFVARRFEFDAEDQRALRDVQGGRSERLFERIALELQRTLDYFDRTHQRPPPRRLLLLGGVEGLEGLGDALRSMLGLDVQRAEPESQWPALATLAPGARMRLAALAATAATAGQP